MSTVRLPSVLRANANGERAIEVDGATIGDAVQALVGRHPALAGQLLTPDGELHRFVNVYLNGRDVRYLAGLETPVEERDEIRLLPAIAGRLTMTAPDLAARAAPARFDGLVESIGGTPIVEIARLSPNPDVRLFAKLEAANPTGSVKDRVARALVEDLEASGRLTPGLDPARGDVRQHRHRAGDDRAPEGLPRRGGHAGQRHGRAARSSSRCMARRSSIRRARSARTARSRWRATWWRATRAS